MISHHHIASASNGDDENFENSETVVALPSQNSAPLVTEWQSTMMSGSDEEALPEVLRNISPAESSTHSGNDGDVYLLFIPQSTRETEVEATVSQERMVSTGEIQCNSTHDPVPPLSPMRSKNFRKTLLESPHGKTGSRRSSKKVAFGQDEVRVFLRSESELESMREHRLQELAGDELYVVPSTEWHKSQLETFSDAGFSDASEISSSVTGVSIDSALAVKAEQRPIDVKATQETGLPRQIQTSPVRPRQEMASSVEPEQPEPFAIHENLPETEEELGDVQANPEVGVVENLQDSLLLEEDEKDQAEGNTAGRLNPYRFVTVKNKVPPFLLLKPRGKHQRQVSLDSELTESKCEEETVDSTEDSFVSDIKRILVEAGESLRKVSVETGKILTCTRRAEEFIVCHQAKRSADLLDPPITDSWLPQSKDDLIGAFGRWNDIPTELNLDLSKTFSWDFTEIRNVKSDSLATRESSLSSYLNRI